MSSNRNQPTTMEKIVEYLRLISTEVGGGEDASGGGEEGRRHFRKQKYTRVPSRPILSVSTTSTSLATSCGSQATLAANAYLPVSRREEAAAESEEDDDRAPLGLTHDSPITIKERNLQNYPITMATHKCQEGSINGDLSPYKPTTQKIFLVTQVVAAIAVSVGSMVVGYASAYSSPATAKMLHENSTLFITEQEASWVGGLMPLAALIGGIIGGLLIDLIGRQTTLKVISIPFFVSWILIANSSAVWMLLTGRALCGFCVGISSLAFPVYLGETLQPEVRGALGILPTCFGNIGILLCFIAGKYMDWTTLAYLGAALPVLFLLLMVWIPETPRWFVSKEQNDKARKSLLWLRGKSTDIETEYNELVMTEKQSSEDKATFGEIIVDRKYVRAVLISLGLMFFQQLSGINAVIFYTVKIFRDAGSNSLDENDCTIIVGIVNFISTFMASFLIDRLGRKILLYVSSIAMVLTLTILGAFFFVKSRNYDVSSVGWLPLACFVVYVIGFSSGFGPIPWLMMGEILPVKIRGPAASLATAFNWSCTFLVTKLFADMITVMGTHGTFWTFGGCCLAGLFFVIFCVPETRGRSLEDIEKKLSGNKGSASTIEC